MICIITTTQFFRTAICPEDIHPRSTDESRATQRISEFLGNLGVVSTDNGRLSGDHEIDAELHAWEVPAHRLANQSLHPIAHCGPLRYLKSGHDRHPSKWGEPWSEPQHERRREDGPPPSGDPLHLTSLPQTMRRRKHTVRIQQPVPGRCPRELASATPCGSAHSRASVPSYGGV